MYESSSPSQYAISDYSYEIVSAHVAYKKTTTLNISALYNGAADEPPTMRQERYCNQVPNSKTGIKKQSPLTKAESITIIVRLY